MRASACTKRSPPPSERTASRLGLLAMVLASLLAWPAVAAASSVELHGHLKTQLSYHLFQRDDLAAVDGRELGDGLLDARLELGWHSGRWELQADLQLIGVGGDSPRLLRDPRVGDLAAAQLGVPAAHDPQSWLDLDHTLSQNDSRLLFTRLDRLTVGYTGDRLVLRLGRQALSWGNGLVFQVLDLFNPFPPNAADTEYKPGTDMLWGQWLFASGDDLQALVVPRRGPTGGPLRSQQSSAAVKWHHFVGPLELDVLAARHFDDTVLGFGTSGSVAGGVGRIDLSWTRLAGGGSIASGLVNLDHSWLWRNHNVYAFAELYHNGFGTTDLQGGLAALTPALLARLERGEVFTVGRDELALGAQFQVTALSSLDPTLIANLHDGSGLALLHWRHDLSDELRLDVGAQLFWGGQGSEYGGLAFTPGVDPTLYLGPGRWIWVRLARYF